MGCKRKSFSVQFSGNLLIHNFWPKINTIFGHFFWKLCQKIICNWRDRPKITYLNSNGMRHAAPLPPSWQSTTPHSLCIIQKLALTNKHYSFINQQNLMCILATKNFLQFLYLQLKFGNSKIFNTCISGFLWMELLL